MRKVLMILVFAAALVVPMAKAGAASYGVVSECAKDAGGSATSIVPFLGAVSAGIGASYMILAQKDQYDEPVWHHLACGLFGDNGRVGNETDSACKHIE